MPAPDVPDSVAETFWDREHGAINGTWVAFGKVNRTADTYSAVVLNPGGKGAYIIVDVDTAAATENFTVNIQVRDPTDGSFNTIFTSAAITATGEYVYFIYPAGVADFGSAFTAVAKIAMPRYFWIYMNHSSTGTWNYSCSVSLLP